ncbi:hypothetical protein V491_05208, partial [Pseudogymnoascus sp. VKM F-3775]
MVWCVLCSLGDDSNLKLLNAGSYDGRSPIALARASPNPQHHSPLPHPGTALNASQPNAPATGPCDGHREIRQIATMMPSPQPLIYAELLPNIRQISVLAALPTPSDATTHVSLSKDRAILTLVHNGTTASLQLPGAIAPTYIPTQPHPTLAQLSWRIPL